MLTNILNAISQTSTTSRKRTQPGKSVRSHLVVESLEDRNLMTTAILQPNGLLAVTGTNNSETITIRQVNNRISVDGIRASWSTSQIRGISVNALAGNDTVLLNSEAVRGQQAITVPAVIDGGAGNDALVGGRGRNLIVGGAGDDRIWGNAGSDVLVGGLGNDTLIGQGGNDMLLGQVGSDALVGGTGNDTLDGGSGSDVLYGEGGGDRFIDEALSRSVKDYRSSEDSAQAGTLNTFNQQVAALNVLITLPAANAGFSDSVDEFMGRVPLMSKVASLDVSPSGKIPTVQQLDNFGYTYIQSSNNFLTQSLGGLQNIPFGYIPDGCYARAHIMDKLFGDFGINNAKLFIRATSNAQISAGFGSRYFPQGVSWGWHVAPLLLVNDGGRLGLRVFDPSIAPRSVTPQTWAARSNVYSAPAQLDAMNRNIYGVDQNLKFLPAASFNANLAAAVATMVDYMSKLQQVAWQRGLADPASSYSGAIS